MRAVGHLAYVVAGLARPALLAILLVGLGSPAASSPQPRPLPGGMGFSVGYPSALGLFVVAPVDAALGYRFGLTGLPGQGLLWSPGFELRFDAVPGLYSTDGLYLFGNALFGRDYHGRDNEELGMEMGLGWRWFTSDVRGFRWVGAVEAGGWWTPESMGPYRPALRLSWMVAHP